MKDTFPVSGASPKRCVTQGGLAILQIYDGGRIAKPELIG